MHCGFASAATRRLEGGEILKSRTIFTASLGLVLAGCGAFGPPRDPPRIPTSANYSVTAARAELPGADGVAQQLKQNAPPIRQWWKEYRSEELDAMVDEALANSPSIAAAQSNLKAARESLRSQIGNSLFPSVDLGASPNRERALGIPVLPQETFIENIFVAQVQASYTFDFFGAAVLADRALARQVQEQALQLESTRRALATNVVMAAINSASLQAQVDAVSELVAASEERARQTAARYKMGSAAREDMLGAEADAANAAATLPPLRAQLLAVRHAQAVLLGRRPDQAPTPFSLASLHLPETLPVSVQSELLHQRPDILAAEAAVRAAADEAGAATASLFPSLSLSTSYGRGGFDWSTFTSPAGAIWGVGAQLTQPLFHGGALQARRRQYQANYEAAVSQYKLTVISAFRSVADSLVSLDEDAQTLSETRRAAEAGRALKEDSESRYRLGSVPWFTVLAAREQYENAVVQDLRARAARLADSAALFDAMGVPRDPPRTKST
jgi:NodT family efflux transporter outer membrane factor (OMF) lipoprotein